MEERKTNLTDFSFNDIIRLMGWKHTDVDHKWYKKVGSRYQTFLVAERKHNGIYGNGLDQIINLRDGSVLNLLDDYGDTVPVLEIITYTKEGEQPHPMLFVLGLNKLGQASLAQVGRTVIDDGWFTPRAFAELVDLIGGEKHKHLDLSDVACRYQLPQLVCNDLRYFDCNCQGSICQLHERNNKLV